MQTKSKPYIVGLTGGIGSGKSTAGLFFEQQGIEVIDADAIAKDILHKESDALQQVVARLGASILLDNGALNRAKLREIIFNNDDERRWLEQLTHPLIRATILQALYDSQSPYVILMSPLLFETQQDKLTNTTVLIDIPESIQKERTQARDGVAQAQIDKIIATQMARSLKRERAEHIVDNSGHVQALNEKLAPLHQHFLNNAHEHKK